MNRRYRLRRPEQFRRVRREGRSYASACLTLNVAPGRRQRVRCGFIVSSKPFTKAVQRNRAKRRVREAVRLALPFIVPGHDLVFVIRSPDVLTMPFAQIRDDVENLLRRAELWQAADHALSSASAASRLTMFEPVRPEVGCSSE